MNCNSLTARAKEFEKSLKILNRSKRTVSEVMRKLSRFIDYLIFLEIEHIDQITKDIVRDYRIEVYQTVNAKGYPNSIAYQNSMLCVVKQFLEYLRDTGYIVSNPARDMAYARQPKTLPGGILSPSEAPLSR